MNSWATRLALSALFITLGVVVGPKELPNVAKPLLGIGLLIFAYQCLKWMSGRSNKAGSVSRVKVRRRSKAEFRPESQVPARTEASPRQPSKQLPHPAPARVSIPPWIALHRELTKPATNPTITKPRPNVIRPSLPPVSRTTLVQPTFAGRGSRVVVGPYKLVDPLIYIADCEEYPDFDASLLCLKRRIDSPRPEPPKALGYWPRLGELKPYQVGNYLDWHAKGRASPEMDIGYVFLFFYGLERRSLIDGQDVAVIGQEVLRLLRIYKGSGSFCGYATGLLAHLIMSGRLMPTDGLIDELLTFQDRYVSDEVSKLLIGYLARERRPLRSNWAMKFAEQSEGASRSVYATRHRAEAEQIFLKKYEMRFGEGIVPVRRDRETSIEYRAASPSLLRGAYAAESLTAHWVSAPGWPRTFAPVVELWNESLVELRQLARRSSPVSTRDDQPDYESLEIVHEGFARERQMVWEKFLSAFTPESGHILIPALRLAGHWGQEGPTLRLKQSRTLADNVQNLGMALEPDARYTGRRYDPEDHIAVLRLPDEPIQVSGPAYALAAAVVRLALVVATADERLDENEARAIVRFVEETLPLSRNEQLRLRALVEVLARDGVSLVGLKKQLETQFDRVQREALGRYLVAVAATSNGIDEAEIAALERGFQTLGLERGLLDQLLFAARQHPEGPVLVAVGSAPQSAERLPSAPTTGLDLSRIRQLRQESDEVAKMLLSAMGTETADQVEDEAEESEETAETTTPITATHSQFPGLRSELESLLQALLKQETLSQATFEQIARTHGTSRAAAINGINEWSDEHLGDFLIEESDPIVIHRHLLSQ